MYCAVKYMFLLWNRKHQDDVKDTVLVSMRLSLAGQERSGGAVCWLCTAHPSRGSSSMGTPSPREGTVAAQIFGNNPQDFLSCALVSSELREDLTPQFRVHGNTYKQGHCADHKQKANETYKQAWFSKLSHFSGKRKGNYLYIRYLEIREL